MGKIEKQPTKNISLLLDSSLYLETRQTLILALHISTSFFQKDKIKCSKHQYNFLKKKRK